MAEIKENKMYSINQIVDLTKMPTTNFSLAYQYATTIDKFNKQIDNKNDKGSAELLYRLNIKQYKQQYATFCLKNSYEICMDSIENRRKEEWKSYQPSTYMEDEQPETYGEATMRHSEYEDILLK
jgi:hypothetical protein|tara:strand:+ start:200 stop:574 length:375 start_codon:yes stop_codon:yes gene_type:complete